MKNIFINNEQYRLIKESLVNNQGLPSWLIDSVSNKRFPLSSDKPYVNEAIIRILEKAYESAVGSFSDDITSFQVDKIENKLNKLILICQKKEEKIKSELEKLCADIVLSLFELNGKELELTCNLVTYIPQTKNFHIKPDEQSPFEYDSIDEINLEDSDEVRRRYTNAITIGAALELTDKLLKKCVSEIFELDEELPYLYTKIVKISNYLLLIKHSEITDENHQQDAYCETSIDDSSNQINILAEGVIFPFLLTESIRGCIEALSFNTLPEKRAEYIVNKCDALQDEPYYMIFGRIFWNMICGNEFDDIYVEKLLQKLMSLDTEKFNTLMDEVLVGTKLGKRGLENIRSKIKYDSDYQSFEKDLANKRKEKEIIVDGYFTESDLDEE